MFVEYFRPRSLSISVTASLINPALEPTTLPGLQLIGAHIRRARKEAFRESRQSFASRLGCTPMTLDRIERGDPGVKLIYVAAALDLMGVLHDVVEAASPKVLIATLKPASFPPGFETDADPS